MKKAGVENRSPKSLSVLRDLSRNRESTHNIGCAHMAPWHVNMMVYRSPLFDPQSLQDRFSDGCCAEHYNLEA